MELTPEQTKLWEAELRSQVESKNIRFVHYTQADAAMDIIRNREIWLRKSSCMNDFLEVQHGLDCMIKSYQSDKAGKKFKAALNEISKGLTDEIEKTFNQSIPAIRWDTYIGCFSQHEDDEDVFGRLSMWRAYGEETGVALVLRNQVFITPSETLPAYATPVAYLDDQGFETEFERVADKIGDEIEFLKLQDLQTMENYIFRMMWFAAISTKHPGFREEREWRIVYSPGIYPSEVLRPEIRNFRGIPQPRCILRLQEISDIKAQIPDILDRLIIGPTKYQQATHQAFCQLLSDAGVSEPHKKVIISNNELFSTNAAKRVYLS